MHGGSARLATFPTSFDPNPAQKSTAESSELVNENRTLPPSLANDFVVLIGNPSQNYGASLAVWDHTVAIRHR